MKKFILIHVLIYAGALLFTGCDVNGKSGAIIVVNDTVTDVSFKWRGKMRQEKSWKITDEFREIAEPFNTKKRTIC